MIRISKLKLKESATSNDFGQKPETAFEHDSYFFSTSIKYYTKIAKNNYGMESTDGYFIVTKSVYVKNKINENDRIKIDGVAYRIKDIIPLSSTHYKLFFQLHSYNSDDITVDGETL